MIELLWGVISNIIPLALLVLAGVLVGKKLSKAQRHVAGKSLTPIVWIILFVIGLSLGESFSSFEKSLTTLRLAAVYSLTLSVFVFVFLMPFSTLAVRQNTGFLRSLIHPAKECLVAFGLVGLGLYCYRFGWQHSMVGKLLLNTGFWLYLLLFIIGVELSATQLSRSWFSWSILRVPVLVILASLCAGVVLSWVLNERLSVALALSSGFGWFSLSGALATQYLGEHYGALALFNDLARELLGIAFVFMLGHRYGQASIGVCGATSADTTLPFIRKGCDYALLPVALMSGLVLTLVAPFMMLFFMGLAN